MPTMPGSPSVVTETSLSISASPLWPHMSSSLVCFKWWYTQQVLEAIFSLSFSLQKLGIISLRPVLTAGILYLKSDLDAGVFVNDQIRLCCRFGAAM